MSLERAELEERLRVAYEELVKLGAATPVHAARQIHASQDKSINNKALLGFVLDAERRVERKKARATKDTP